jgi:hypothetical protein
MNDDANPILPSLAALGSIGVIALYLTLTRGLNMGRRVQVEGVVQISLVLLQSLFQVTHVAY